MNRRIQILALIVIVSFFCFGFEGILLKDYKTENQDEKGILATLICFEEAFNKQDIETVLSCLSDEVKFRPFGYYDQISKEEFVNVLQYQFLVYKSKIHYNPKISVSGDKAYVDCQLDTSVYIVDYHFAMAKQNDKWLIIESQYSKEKIRK